MADYTQSKSTTIAHAAVTHPESIEGTSVDVATFLSCMVVMWHALIEATANTNPGKFRVFGSLDSSGNDAWFHIVDFEVTNATAATEAMTATEPIGEKVLACASTTGFTAATNIYVQDASVETDSEWHPVDKIVTNTSVDIMEGLVTQKDSADFLWSDAQHFKATLNCAHLSRVRVDFSHEGATGANCVVKAEVKSATDIV